MERRLGQFARRRAGALSGSTPNTLKCCVCCKWCKRYCYASVDFEFDSIISRFKSVRIKECGKGT